MALNEESIRCRVDCEDHQHELELNIGQGKLLTLIYQHTPWGFLSAAHL
jgi:hypothetical protein